MMDDADQMEILDKNTSLDKERKKMTEDCREKILNRVADLLEADGGWTQGANARDKNNQHCDVKSSEAVTFCLVGGIRRICLDYDELSGWPVMHAIRNQVIQQVGYPITLDHWNDSAEQTQEQVVATIRAAALKAKENTCLIS